MDDKKLRIWVIISSENYEAMDYLNSKFSPYEQKNNINIQIEYVTWERAWPALINAFKQNNAPDVLQVGTSWVKILSHMGYLAEVPPGIDIKLSINEGINKICRHNGKYVALPWLVDTIIMAGRRDYMEELGIKRSDVETWQGLRQTAEKVADQKEKNKNIPKAISVAVEKERDTIQRFSSILWAFGWEYPDLHKTPEKILQDSLVVESIKYFNDLKIICDKPEELGKHPYQINEDFYIHGLSIFYIGSWYGIVNRVLGISEDKRNKYCVLPFPTSADNSCSYGGGTVLAVSSQSKKKEEAWKLAEYLLSDDFMRGWINKLGNVPAYNDKFWEKRFDDNRVQLMYEQTINSHVYPLHPAWIAVENLLIEEVGQLFIKIIKSKRKLSDKEILFLLKIIDYKIKRILRKCWELK